ncbi:MAG: Xaa-Pro peptidase family protein [Lutisporaceae bacterium]
MKTYKAVMEKAVEIMKSKNIKAMVLSPSSNMFYMTGFNTFLGERLLVNILVHSGESVFIVPKLYESEVKEKAEFDEIYSWNDNQDPQDIIKLVAEKYGLQDCTVAIEETMWFTAFNKIFSSLKGVKYVHAAEVIGELRQCKSSIEAEKMRKASQIADKALSNILNRIKQGLRETEVRDILEGEMKALGATATSFPSIIGSGSNSALPHHNTADRILKEGDAVVIDFGCIADNYCSDTTRTVVIGQASEKYKKVYEILKQAQQLAIDKVKPGVKACEVDYAARKHIADNGYGEYFLHRTGHGIGLEVHEMPYITESSEVILKPGMVFSIEPGIYLEGEFGIRIEDLVMVTEDGVEVLNHFTKELVEV